MCDPPGKTLRHRGGCRARRRGAPGAEEEPDHGDLTPGLRHRFLDSEEGRWRPSLGVQPLVKFPIADAPIDALSLDTAVVYLVTQRIALDAAIQTSLIRRAPDYALRAGATVRFGR